MCEWLVKNRKKLVVIRQHSNSHVWLLHGNTVRWQPNFLGALSFWGTPNFICMKGFTFFIFFHFLFNMYDSNCFKQSVCNIFKKGGGILCIIFCCFCDFKFNCQTKYVEHQVEGEIIKHACEWNDHTIMTWHYESANVIYFLSQEEGKYDVNISWLLKDILYKNIPLTLYVRT